MVRSSRVICSVLPRRAIVGLFATFPSIALLPCAVAAADTVSTNFEPNLFHTGSVNGQDGWKSAVPGDIPSLPNGYDQAVVANSAGPASFGAQSLRISNAFGTGPETFPPEFAFQTYSKPTKKPLVRIWPIRNTPPSSRSFPFIRRNEQPGLRIYVSPDNGGGGRMSYIGLDEHRLMASMSFSMTLPTPTATSWHMNSDPPAS